MKKIAAILIFGAAVATFGFAAEPARMLSSRQVRELTAKAATPAEHQRLAAHFAQLADRLEAESKEHSEMAGIYRTHPGVADIKRPGAADTMSHCSGLAEDLAKAAKDARTLAAGHRQMAN